MEGKVISEISQKIEKGEIAALVTITEVQGSSPGKEGSIMGVFFDGSTIGTVGGGELEGKIIERAIKSMKENKNTEFHFSLTPNEKMDMRCGGNISGYIKVFQSRNKLIILGGGHLGLELYKLGKFLNMYTVIIDDRKEFANKDRFPLGDEIIVGNISEILKEYETNINTYIVIITRGHLEDKTSLKVALTKKVPYIGMIGSRKKVKETFQELLEEGFNKNEISGVFSPVGLDISNDEPKEIAFGIMAEILKIKNNGSGKHMKEIKIIEI